MKSHQLMRSYSTRRRSAQVVMNCHSFEPKNKASVIETPLSPESIATTVDMYTLRSAASRGNSAGTKNEERSNDAIFTSGASIKLSCTEPPR